MTTSCLRTNGELQRPFNAPTNLTSEARGKFWKTIRKDLDSAFIGVHPWLIYSE
jgi:hypothetical protein